MSQFGAGFGWFDNFRMRFLPNLKLALAVYTETRVEVGDKGRVRHPSRPPVSREKALAR